MIAPATDRLFWLTLSRVWRDWRPALAIVKPETAIRKCRKAFRLFRTWKIRYGKPKRPAVLSGVKALIRRMSRDSPLWGAPRIHDELPRLGIDIGETSVSK